MVEVLGELTAPEFVHDAVHAIAQHIGADAGAEGLCLLVLDNMDFVEIAGTAAVAAELRRLIHAELLAAFGDDCILLSWRDDSFLISLRGADRLRLLGRIDQLLHRLPFIRRDQRAYSTSVTARAGVVWLSDVAGKSAIEIHQTVIATVVAARSTQKARVVYGCADAVAIRATEQTAQLLCDLPAAVEEDRLFLLAQEIVSCAPAAPRGREYEVLLQMRGRDGQAYPPGAFLEAAEQSRLIEIIDSWVMRTVLVGRAAELRDRPHMSLSLNVAARTLSNPGFRGYLAGLLTEGGISPRRIQIEITETAQIRDLQQAQANIRAARAMGCRIALDDFGAGMSGYGYLKTFEPDCIKIDGSLIPNVADPENIDARIVQSIVGLAHQLGIEVVAEHVSSREIFDALSSFGVDKVQGYQFGRPAPLDSLFASPVQSATGL